MQLPMHYRLPIIDVAAAYRIVQAKLAPSLKIVNCKLIIEPPKGGV